MNFFATMGMFKTQSQHYPDKPCYNSLGLHRKILLEMYYKIFIKAYICHRLGPTMVRAQFSIDHTGHGSWALLY